MRRQVCRRVRRRVADLGLDGPAEYRALLERDPGEWQTLEALLNVTISRFYRDRGVWDALRDSVLPALAAAGRPARVWSAGCAGGEEAYTVALAWALEVAPCLGLEVLGTDVEPAMLARAQAARYGASSLRELPEQWRAAGFLRDGDDFVLADQFRRPLRLERHDLRSGPPERDLDLVLCRYSAFTYFDEAVQRTVARNLAAATRPGGVLVIGPHEKLPTGEPGFDPLGGVPSGIFTRGGG